MANKRKSEHSLTNEAMATNTKKGRAARRYECEFLDIEDLIFSTKQLLQCRFNLWISPNKQWLNLPQLLISEGFSTTDDPFACSLENRFRLTDVSDEATIEHQGKPIKLTKSMLIDIQSLGAGQYAEAVIQCEVQGHPELQMAVKVIRMNMVDQEPERTLDIDC